MGKATQKTSPVQLGTKRACPSCATKFYDFGRDEVVCPKCNTKLDPQNLQNPLLIDKKAARSPEKAEEASTAGEEIVIDDGDDAFESIEDLEDEEDDLVEDIEVDGEGEEGT